MYMDFLLEWKPIWKKKYSKLERGSTQIILEFDDSFYRDFSSGISKTAIFIRIQTVQFDSTFFNSRKN